MYKILILCVAALVSYSAVADEHSAAEDEVLAAAKTFNEAYAANDVERYFNHYADDAMVYFSGARQTVSGYHDEWVAMIDAGGAVEKNALSDMQVKVMPGGNIAVASYFVDYRMRAPDGEIARAKAFESEVWQKIDGAWKVVALHYTEIAPQ